MKLFLIDGHSLVFKMYYAFLGRPMLNSKGVDTSIIFGFTKYLLELIARESPSHLAIAFDPPGGTFRNEIYPQYKANRSETPQLVIDALEPLITMLESMHIPVLMLPGFEADDVIGSAALHFSAEGFNTYMVTPDKDYGQLVGPNVFQYRPGKAGSDNEILGQQQICDKWGIASPSQVVDILTICGDSADNVPGVAGVGPVGASKLLNKYGSLESIYDHLDELSPSLKTKFAAAKDHIALSKTLVTIKTDIDIKYSSKDLVLEAINTPEFIAFLHNYEMPSLLRLLSKICASNPSLLDGSSQIEPVSQGVLDGALSQGHGNNSLNSTFNTISSEEFKQKVKTRLSDKGSKIAILLDGQTLFLATNEYTSSADASFFAELLSNESIIKAGSDIKAQANALYAMGIELKGRMEDISLMHYLLNPEKSHKVETLAQEYLGIDLNIEPAQACLSLFDEPQNDIGLNRDKEVEAIYRLSGLLLAELEKTESLYRLYNEIEEPLIRVLLRMEQVGVRIDPDSLKDYAQGLRSQMLDREQEVRTLSKCPQLNVSSPKQIGEVIYEKLRLAPNAKKPKNGNWPTDEQTLQELSDKSPIIDAILDYRGLRKLLSTYIEPLPSYISSKDGRVHTTFNQALTATGRLSSSNPNLQNIPIRTEQGREVRKAFVAKGEDAFIVSADYSQIELRIMAHLCADEHLQEAFRSGLDVHAATASKIFRVPIQNVSSEQRRVAKTANFGIMYGISAFGLSQRLKCSRTEAKQIIDDYFSSFPSIRYFIEETINKARQDGYVQTIFGRRRYLPDISGPNANLRSLAERNAVNAPIQGSSADIIKLAMIAVDKAIMDNELEARMVLQIHDELVIETPSKEIEILKNILVKEMEGVVNLSVPLTVECNYGKNWLEAH